MNGLVILDLLPGRMDVNGDGGNVLAATRRLAWARLDATVVTGDDARWWTAAPDLVHVGGPTAAGQRAALEHVGDRRERLHEWAADGVPVLGVAGGFHLLLDEVLLPGAAAPVAGLGLLRGTSRPGAARVSGFVVVATPIGAVHGYHNLGQEALLGDGAEAWGRVVLGRGNRPGHQEEGAVAGSVLGTNLHGPLLPRNPAVADALLRSAAERRGLAYAPTDRHRAADAIAEQANRVLRARASAPGTATYVPATAGRRGR